MKKICLISNLHLSANPRLWKEANTLANAGYNVVILTIWTSAKKREQDLSLIGHPGIQYKGAINLIKGEINDIQRFYIRLKRRLGVEAKRYLKVDNKWIIDYEPPKMLVKALDENADLYICHTEYGMLIGHKLSCRQKRVAFDIEDWYSKDYIVPSRPVALLEQLERVALKEGVYCTCPSLSMAAALERFYNSGKKVHVIYNGFSSKDRVATGHLDTGQRLSMPSLIWFSQTIGPGRGLEILMGALKELNTKIQLHLLGECTDDYANRLKELFPFSIGHQMFIHAPVAHNDLLSKLEKYDIGLALEQNFPESRNTTVTNKILQYIQAGLKILATSTNGQQEVADAFKESVRIVPVNDIQAWVNAIEELIALKVDKAMQVEKFNDTFSWEAQEGKFLQLVKSALEI